MAINARKQTIPAGSDTTVSRATIFEGFGNSIRDVVPVADTTARAQLVTDLTAAGQAPSSTKPLVVYRHDAPGAHRLEWTADGTVWVTASGVLRFANDAARNTWTTSNSAYLSTGDICFSNNLPFRWTGTVWVAASWQAVTVSARKTTSTAITATTMTNVLTVALPASAPPGIYQVLAFSTTWSGSATSHFKQVRYGGTATPGSGTLFDGTTDGVSAAGGSDVVITFMDTFTHTGGALDFWLDVQVNAGSPNANAGCRLQVVFLGFA